MTALPAWAEWNTAAAGRPWTIGLEEEVLLVDPVTLAPASESRAVLDALPAPLAGHVFQETHACVLELVTGPNDDVPAAAGELVGLRRALTAVLRDLGLSGGVAGTHPLAVWDQIEISDGERYGVVRESMRELARREPTCALHVHVAVPGAEAAIRALAGLREDLPLLLALSANSPYWQGRDTGLASARIPILAMFPRVSIPPPVSSYGEYVAAVELLTASRAVADPSFIWWDARLRPHIGTVEVRIMDAQTTMAETAGLAALVQCLVRHHAVEPAPGELTAEALAENRFIASRDGIAAQLIRAQPPHLEPAADRLARTLSDCAPLAAELGCAHELEGLAALLAQPGHARQRSIARRDGLDAVVVDLATAFGCPPDAGSGTRRQALTAPL